MLGSSTRIMLFLLVCTGLLANSRYKVSAMRSRELFLRKTQGHKAGVHPGETAKLKGPGFHFRNNHEDQGKLKQNQRILEDVNKNKVKTEKTQEEKKKTNDSYQSSKRRVRRGSDPIHNKA